MSAIDWKPLAEKILEILKESAAEYWHLTGVADFMKDIANQFAKWKLLAATTVDPVKRAEYESVLLDLNARIDIKIASALMDLHDSVKDTLKSILKAVGTFLLKIAAPVVLTALGLPPLPI